MMTRNTISYSLLKVSGFTLLLAAVMAVPFFVNSALPGLIKNIALIAAEEEEGRRAPPEARSSQTLGRRVFTRINEVMELRDMELYAEALEVLGEIKEDFDRDRLNDREKFVMWQFYANIYQVQENYDGAIESYREILTLDNLNQEQLEQSLFYLGSLYYVQEKFPEAIEQFLEYNEYALEPNDDVYF